MGDAVILLFLCCFCIILSAIGGGLAYSYECPRADQSLGDIINASGACFCGIDWCETGKICNASGECISGINPDSNPPHLCEHDPCGVGVRAISCTASGTNAICDCKPGYSGPHCSAAPPDPCNKLSVIDCINGIKIPDGDECKCHCFNGWKTSETGCNTPNPNWEGEGDNALIHHFDANSGSGEWVCKEGYYGSAETFGISGNTHINSSGNKICNKCPGYDITSGSNTSGVSNINEPGNNSITDCKCMPNDDIKTPNIALRNVSGTCVLLPELNMVSNIPSKIVNKTGEVVCNNYYGYYSVNGSCISRNPSVSPYKNKSQPDGRIDNVIPTIVDPNVGGDSCGLFSGRIINSDGENYSSIELRAGTRESFTELKTDMEHYYKHSDTFDQFKTDTDDICHYKKNRVSASSTCSDAGFNASCTDCSDGHKLVFSYENGFQCLDKGCTTKQDCFEGSNEINDIPFLTAHDKAFLITQEGSKVCKNNELLKGPSKCDVDPLNNQPNILEADIIRGEIKNRFKLNPSGKIVCKDTSVTGECIFPPPPLNTVKCKENGDSGAEFVNDTCQCSPEYLGSLCNISLSEFCGDGNDMEERSKRELKKRIDPIGGYKYDKNGDIIPKLNGSIYNTTIGNASGEIDSGRYSCICNSGDPQNRKGQKFTGYTMEPDTFCNSPAPNHTNTDSETPTGNVKWVTMYMPNDIYNLGIKNEEKNISNMYSYLDCGSKEFTSSGNVVNPDGSDDGGVRTGHYYSNEYGESPTCRMCPASIHGTNQIKVSDYYGFGGTAGPGYLSHNKTYDNYEDRLDLINGTSTEEDENTIKSNIPHETYSTSRYFDLCTPAYPGYYGSISSQNPDDGLWKLTPHASDTIEDLEDPPVFQGGEKIHSSGRSKPVKTDYTAIRKDHTTTFCKEKLNWIPPGNFAISGANCKVLTDGADITKDWLGDPGWLGDENLNHASIKQEITSSKNVTDAAEDVIAAAAVGVGAAAAGGLAAVLGSEAALASTGIGLPIAAIAVAVTVLYILLRDNDVNVDTGRRGRITSDVVLGNGGSASGCLVKGWPTADNGGGGCGVIGWSSSHIDNNEASLHEWKYWQHYAHAMCSGGLDGASAGIYGYKRDSDGDSSKYILYPYFGEPGGQSGELLPGQPVQWRGAGKLSHQLDVGQGVDKAAVGCQWKECPNGVCPEFPTITT